MSRLALNPLADRPRLARPDLADSGHLPSLDGLRGLAILLVMPHNLLVFTDPAGWGAHLLLGWLERGWTGVQLFFALSGFLITGLLLDTADCAHRLRVFYARRALRIFPLYYLALVVMLWWMPRLHWPPTPLNDSGPLWASYWVFLSNWFTPYDDMPSLPHFWSLAVEEQFYLVWPLLLYRLKARQAVALGVSLAALSCAARVAMVLSQVDPDVLYESTLSRIEPLVLGGAAAAALRDPSFAAWLAARRRAIGAVSWGALLLTALSTHLHSRGAWQQTLGYAGLSIACVAAVAWAALADRAVGLPGRPWPGAWLRAGWLRHVGRYSYGLYVVHVPLSLLAGRPLLAHLGYRVLGTDAGEVLQGAPLLAYLACGMALSYGLALLSYHAIEKHCLRLKPAYRPSG